MTKTSQNSKGFGRGFWPENAPAKPQSAGLGHKRPFYHYFVSREAFGESQRECGSFRAASERLGLPAAPLSRQVAALDARFGKRFVHTAVDVLAEFDALETPTAQEISTYRSQDLFWRRRSNFIGGPLRRASNGTPSV